MKKVLHYNSSQICYYTYGSGNRIIFCFHGYGQSGESFSVLQTVLGADFTLICIDLPFHGNTLWQNELLFSDNILWAIIQKINPYPNEPFCLMGYSLGGRIALQLLQNHPDLIQQVALIAPDGLKFNWWQHLATNTKIGHSLFRFTMRHPQWLITLIRLSSTLHLINISVEKFSLAYIFEANERCLLYERWCVLKSFKPNMRVVRKLISQHRIPINLLFGEYDKIITTNQGVSFKKDEPLISVKEIKCGHQLIKEKYALEVAKLIVK